MKKMLNRKSGEDEITRRIRSGGENRKVRKDFVIYPAGILIVTVFAAIHFLDVRAGALESGDFFLRRSYMLLSAAAVAVCACAGYLLLLNRRVKLETAFLACILSLGLLFLCVLPPLSAPDEVSHYISAYKLSNRLMGKPTADEHGLVYIRAEDRFVEDLDGEYEKAEAGEDADLRVLGQTLTEETYRIIEERGFWGASRQEMVRSSQWAVRTTPLAYAPQALGITLARLLSMNGIGLLYMGRLFNLLFYVLMGWLAMRKLPFGKEILFGVGLFPMTLHLAASMSYDVMILSMAFYFTAYCLHLAYRASSVRWRDVCALAAVMAVLGPCKMVYGALMGLCLLIPVKKFGGWKYWGISAAAVLACFGISMFLVNSQTIASYAAAESYVPWAEEAGYSISMLIHNPGQLFKMFYNTLVWQAEYYHLTMIGAYLGNVDLVLDVPYLVIAGFTVGIVGLCLKKPGESVPITGGRRIWVWFLALGCAGAILFSMLIAWTPVSSSVINGVQGRYFLPFLPVLLMTFKNDRVVLTGNPSRKILYLMCCADAYVLLRLFGTVSMRL